MRLVKEVVECRMAKASCWSWDAFAIPLPPLGGLFRVTALGQLREIAAEKEATWIMQKTKGWIYSWWWVQLRLCGWRPGFFGPIAVVRWEAGWYGDGSACCPNGGARNRLGHERNERNEVLSDSIRPPAGWSHRDPPFFQSTCWRRGLHGTRTGCFEQLP